MSDNELKSRKRKRRQSLSAVVFSLAMFGYPLVGNLISLLQVDSRSLSVSFRLLVFFLCIWIVLTRCFRLRFDEWRGLLLLVWGALVARLVYDSTFGGVEIADYALFFFVATVLLPVFALWSCNDWDTHLFARFGLLVASAVCLLSVLGQALGLFGEADLTAATGRLSMIALNPISLGHLASSGIFCALVLGRDAKLGWRSILGLLVILFLMVLVQTGSKSSVLALALPLLAWFTQRRAWSGIIISVLIIGIITVFTNTPVTSRMSGALDDPYTTDRVSLIKDSIQQIIESPLLGSSFVDLKSGYYPHNIFLEAPMAFGLPFSMAVFLLLAYGSLFAWRALNSNFDLIGLLFLQGLVAGLTSSSMFAATGLWIPMALMRAKFTAKSLNPC